MNLRRLAILTVLASGAVVPLSAQAPALAAPAPAETNASSPKQDLAGLVDRIRAKLKSGKPTAESLSAELKEFDGLIEKYCDQKTEEVAQIAFMRATLYGEVLGDTNKMKELITKLSADFPDTKVGAAAAGVVTQIEQRAKAEAASNAIVGKAAPELHFKWATREGLKTLADLKGKVVVLDFWATWCGPCVRSFPEVAELTAHYRDMDVIVVGVTSIQGAVTGLEPKPIDTKGAPEKEMALMKDYIAAKKITWAIAFSEEEVFNPDYGITGIPHMVIIAPDGTVRHRGLHPAEPLADKVEKIDAILKEFKLPVLASSPNK